MNQSIVDRLLPLVEAYAAGRKTQKAFWRQMRALKCLDAFEGSPCWKTGRVQCRECQAKSEVFKLFASSRAENRRLRGRIEALGLRLHAPVVVEPEEPKPLLDLMVEQ